MKKQFAMVLAACIIFIAVFVFAQPNREVPAKAIDAGAQAGRFEVMPYGPEAMMMLDTATGRMWLLSYDEENNPLGKKEWKLFMDRPE